jgi:outer membrane protein TolC
MDRRADSFWRRGAGGGGRHRRAAAVAVLVAAAAARGEDPGDLRSLVVAALEVNPRVGAARQELLAAQADASGVAGFFDPRAILGAGAAQEGRTIPGTPRDLTVPDDGWAAQAGLEQAVLPGFYLGAGIAERRLEGAGDGDEDFYQTLGGVQVRVPLLKDRGFVTWHSRRAAAWAAWRRAAGALVGAMQDVRRDVERGYVTYQQALVNVEVAAAATARARRLVEEAGELVRLEATPAYQLHTARLQMALSEEEEESARRLARDARLALAVLAGEATAAAVAEAPVDLVAWGAGIERPATEGVADCLPRRGPGIEIDAAIREAQARLREAQTETEADLSVRAAYTWEGEDRSDVLGDASPIGGDGAGGEVSVFWTHPLGARASRSRVAALRARLAGLAEQRRRLEWDVAADLDRARNAFDAARERMACIEGAVQEARDALAAEEERFRLGDGTSRQVLDAQKDLTAALRRRNDIASDLLRAWADHRHAAGLGVTPPQMDPSP